MRIIIGLLLILYFNQGLTQTEPSFQMMESKAVGLRWKFPAGWKISELQTGNLVKIEALQPDTTLECSIVVYPGKENDVQEIADKVIQENNFMEEQRLNTEINGMEVIVLEGSITNDDPTEGIIFVLTLPDERIGVLTFFVNEGGLDKKRLIIKQISQSLEAIITADDVEDEEKSKPVIEEEDDDLNTN